MKGVSKISHYVTCPYCKVRFDRDKSAYVQPRSRQYAHASCYLREREKNNSLPELEVHDPTEIVTCKFCKKPLNKKTDKCIKVDAIHWAHEECAHIEETREKTDSEKLDAYIMKLFDTGYVSPRIRKQINTYISDYNFSYSGIYKALYYFFEIKKNDVDKANGIGIVPYVYKDAYRYYYDLWLANQKNSTKDVADYIPRVREIRIPPPKREIQKTPFFSFLDDEEE